MIDHLYSKIFYEPITDKKLAKMSNKDLAKLDRKAMTCLRQWGEQNVDLHQSQLSCSIWD